LVGPAIASIGEGDGGVITLSVLPAVLPLGALVFVAVDVSRRTGNALKAAAFTGGSLALVLVGACVYLLIAWQASSGS
jgi:amino acid permease